LECTFPNLGIYIDTAAPYLVLTDKNALGPNFDPNNPPPTQVDCTETPASGPPVQGTGSFQQLQKSGTIDAGGGQGPDPTGLVVQETVNGDGTTTAIVRYYVDNRASTDEVARYQITFQTPSDICADGNGGYFNPCIHKMGLPDPLNAGEAEVTKGGTTFPAEGLFEQYVMEKMDMTTNAAGEPIAFTDFHARWCQSGSEDGTDVIVCSVTIKGKTQKITTAAESTLDILVEFIVGPVVTSLTGVVPVYVLSSAEFDATTITATEIEVNGVTVTCRSTGTEFVNADDKADWRCAAEKSQFVPAATNCPQTSATATFAVQVVFDGKERTARDLASTFPVNCN
jgi:hypothetical protein